MAFDMLKFSQSFLVFSYHFIQNKHEQYSPISQLAPPVIYSSPASNITLLEDDHVNVSCLASGSPNPDIWWYKQTPHVWKKLSERTLRIENAKVDDSGEYLCRATNFMDTVEKTVKLTVYGERFYPIMRLIFQILSSPAQYLAFEIDFIILSLLFFLYPCSITCSIFFTFSRECRLKHCLKSSSIFLSFPYLATIHILFHTLISYSRLCSIYITPHSPSNFSAYPAVYLFTAFFIQRDH